MDGRLSLEEFIEVRYSDRWTRIWVVCCHCGLIHRGKIVRQMDKNMDGNLSLENFIEVKYSNRWTTI